MKNRYVLLSFDVEEFDMPLEFGHSITLTEQLEAGKKGLDAIAPLLNNSNLQPHFSQQLSLLKLTRKPFANFQINMKLLPTLFIIPGSKKRISWNRKKYLSLSLVSPLPAFGCLA